ncbi:hypothetical protein [Lacipirellula sp.]|uniref:hypothetical protein n=1 Tax=Lacipirellula sp. TaxID=2691419 RepID=UPI003D0F5157
MEMTPEKRAFISGQSKPPGVSMTPVSAKDASEQTIDVQPSNKKVEADKDSSPRPQRRNRRSTHDTPSSSQVLDQMLVPVTIRLPRRTAQSLRRAHLEQRLKDAKPDTQQEIAEEALVDWLAKYGYLD